jgi:hypothetical protein
MGEVFTVKRKDVFKEQLARPFTTNDSRFGIRKFFLTTKERPSIKGYTRPGKGPNGESQN